MAIVTGAALSLGASGQLGKTVTLRKRRGVTVASAYAKPRRPPSPAQLRQRALVGGLTKLFKLAGPQFQYSWGIAGCGVAQTVTGLFTKANARALHSSADMAPFVFSPLAYGGLPVVYANFGSVVGGFTCTYQMPAFTPQYPSYGSGFFGIRNQDPYAITDPAIWFEPVDTSLNSVTHTGLPSGIEYVIALVLWTGGLSGCPLNAGRSVLVVGEKHTTL